MSDDLRQEIRDYSDSVDENVRQLQASMNETVGNLVANLYSQIGGIDDSVGRLTEQLKVSNEKRTLTRIWSDNFWQAVNSTKMLKVPVVGSMAMLLIGVVIALFAKFGVFVEMKELWQPPVIEGPMLPDDIEGLE